jgi:AcrR family transcriptional regulator
MSTKREQVLKTARTLFWKFGIKRVSIEEICREANLSKMTFYKHFQNKNDLTIAILKKLQDDAFRKYRDIMDRDIPFPEKIEQSIQLKFEQTNNLSEEFFNDLHKNASEEILAYFQEIYQESIQIILKDYVEAQKQGNIRSDIKPEFIVYFLNLMIKIANDPELQVLYGSPQEVIMELTRFFFYGVLPRS